jgi:hypothetical protein
MATFRHGSQDHTGRFQNEGTQHETTNDNQKEQTWLNYAELLCMETKSEGE